MVDWQNPVIILQELGALLFFFSKRFFTMICWARVGALVKVIHVVDGIYL